MDWRTVHYAHDVSITDLIHSDKYFVPDYLDIIFDMYRHEIRDFYEDGMEKNYEVDKLEESIKWNTLSAHTKVDIIQEVFDHYYLYDEENMQYILENIKKDPLWIVWSNMREESFEWFYGEPYPVSVEDFSLFIAKYMDEFPVDIKTIYKAKLRQR